MKDRAKSNLSYLASTEGETKRNRQLTITPSYVRWARTPEVTMFIRSICHKENNDQLKFTTTRSRKKYARD